MFSRFFSIFPKKSFKRSASSRAYHILYGPAGLRILFRGRSAAGNNAAAFQGERRGVVGRAVGGGRKVPRIPYFFSFSRSRISPSSFSSFEGSGSGAGAAGTSAFLRLKRLMSFTIRNTHQATMRKSMQVWMKAP